MIRLTTHPIQPQILLSAVRSKRHGGVVLFLGDVRNHDGHGSSTRKARVTRLEYSAYDSMALKMMNRIVQEAKDRWRNRGIGNVAVVHRLGRLRPGDCAVAVAAAAEHRAEAFDACRYVIDQLKHRAPIFKKEFFTDGKSKWVVC